MTEEQDQAGTGGPSLLEELTAANQEPMTFRDRIVGIGMALVMLGLAAWMFIRPVLLPVDTSDLSGRRGSRLVMLLDMAWSRPVGVVVALLALLVLWGSLTKRSSQEP